MDPTSSNASPSAASSATKSSTGGTPSSSNAARSSSTDALGTAASAPPNSMEFEPPLACVRRILKHALPSSTNVGKDASAAFARSTGIFILYITACANDFARENKRQTITANDVLAAVRELDFEEFTPEMNRFLEHHRKQEKQKKDAKEAKKQASAEKMNIDREHSNDDASDSVKPEEASLSKEKEGAERGDATAPDTRASKDDEEDEEEDDEELDHENAEDDEEDEEEDDEEYPEERGAGDPEEPDSKRQKVESTGDY